MVVKKVVMNASFWIPNVLYCTKKLSDDSSTSVASLSLSLYSFDAVYTDRERQL
jgi:hypothetical protein